MDRTRWASRTLAPTDPGYPPRLRERLGERAPRELLAAGELPGVPLVAVVGTRAASRHSVELAALLARALVAAGYGVLSGGAIGVDAAAHGGALDARGDTVAVLGSGLDQPYPPRNRELFARMIAARGALVTTHPAGTIPRRAHFPQRNRLIAAWAEAVMVIEAPPRSGALNTARWARGLGVPVLACPGSAGTAGLIARGAPAVRDADELLAALRGGAARRRPEPCDLDERAALAAARVGGAGVDAIARRAGLGVARAAAALIRLELAGWVERSADGGYRASG